MAEEPSKPVLSRERWTGTLGLVLAAAGSAIGLGNLWKFPYITWINGGGLFVLLYLVCIVLVGLPIMICEFSLGKLSQKDPVGAYKALGGKTTPFRFVGLLGVLSGFVILSYYSVIAGWGLQYTLNAVGQKFASVPLERVAELEKENLAFVKEEAYKSVLAGKMTVTTQMQMLVDAKGTSKERQEDDLVHNVPLLTEKLIQNKKLQKWHDQFYALKKSQDDYSQWLQQTLLPVYMGTLFTEFLDTKELTVSWHTVFMVICVLIVMMGVRRGIEKAARWMMPLLGVFLIVLMINSLLLDENNQALQFLFVGDPSKLHWASSLEALGHAFFTLSLGMGAMITYASYLPKENDMIKDSFLVVGMDSLIAIFACLMIFPILFVYNIQPNPDDPQTAGMLFVTMPLELYKFPGGAYLTILFYLLVLFAALTSAISLLEVVVAYFVDEQNLSRVKASLLAGGLIFACGLPSSFSTDFLTHADNLATRVLLPLGGLLTAVFVGYRIDLDLLRKEFAKFHYPPWMFKTFKFTLRYLTPLLIFAVVVNMLRQYFK